MELIVSSLCVVSFVVGFFIARLYFKRKPVGKLHIETSDPDAIYLFVELANSIDFLTEQKEVLLTIDTKNYVTHD